MAAAKPFRTTAWSRWLQAQLDARGWGRGDLIDRGIAKDRVSKWIRGEEVPQMDHIRAVCAILEIPAADGMVAAGRLQADDVRGLSVVRVQDARELSDRALLDELAERLAERSPSAGEDEADASADRPKTVTPIRAHAPYPSIRPEGRRGTDWAARPRPE